MGARVELNTRAYIRVRARASNVGGVKGDGGGGKRGGASRTQAGGRTARNHGNGVWVDDRGDAGSSEWVYSGCRSR